MEEELLNSYKIKLKDCVETGMSDDYLETLIKGIHLHGQLYWADKMREKTVINLNGNQK